MKALSDYDVEEIKTMDYNALISLVRETNRVPGGYKTIAHVLNNTFLRTSDRVLEIGTSTGDTAIEIARISRCTIDAIDINERSLQEARRRAHLEGLDGYITFTQDDAQSLSFADSSFDMVFCGNVTSLIPNREKARAEYVRVLKPGGTLVAVPMYYLDKPSSQLLERVRKAIQVKVEVLDGRYWEDFYKQSGLILKLIDDYRFDYIDNDTLDSFIDYILGRPFLRELRPEAFEELAHRYRDCIHLFRDNLSHMGYSIMLYRHEQVNPEPELFRGHPLSRMLP